MKRLEAREADRQASLRLRFTKEYTNSRGQANDEGGLVAYHRMLAHLPLPDSIW